MAFVIPLYTRAEVNRAGALLASQDAEPMDWVWAYGVLGNWRAAHAYPINTFQATLRSKLKFVDGQAIVAQRMKRAPSVEAKLRRFPTMKLAQMQDIGGLRAVVGSVRRVRMLEASYQGSKFKHKLVSSKDYIRTPKADGYRGVHLVYQYANPLAPVYDGLHLEIQLRTRLQHAWATAVETMGTFLGQALKAGQGPQAWKDFFRLASAAFTFVERSPLVPGFEGASRNDILQLLTSAEKQLNVLYRLKGFSIATNRITTDRGSGRYHLVVLDSENRTVRIRRFSANHLDVANEEYAKVEERTQRGERVEAVLVAAGPLADLKRAYPNFFLDTNRFVFMLRRMIQLGNA